MTGELRTVRLEGIPVVLHRLAGEHGLTVRREVAMLDTAERGALRPGLQGLPAMRGPFDAFMAAFRPVFQEALKSPSPLIDIECQVPASAADVAEHLDHVLDDIDEFCRAGNLVTPVAPPEVVAYRKWLLHEFVEQLRHGRAPQPYPSGRSFAGTAAPSPSGAAAVVVVEGDLDLEGAEPVREAIASAVENGAHTITLDFAGCDFVDSVGVSLLLTTWMRLSRDGGRLVIVHAGERVRATLGHAGVLEMLFPDE